MALFGQLLRDYATKRGASDDLTTKGMCNNFLKPDTIVGRCSVWEALRRSGLSGIEKHIGKPKWFVSHAWSYKINTLCSIIAGATADDPDTLFFLDCISMNQHDLAEVSRASSMHECKVTSNLFQRLHDNLEKAITTSSKVMLVLDSWDYLAPLSRCWCLYEVYVAYANNIPLTMAFSGQAASGFVDGLKRNQHKLEHLINSVDARDGQAAKEDDRRMILTKIKTVGFDCYNEFIRSTLKGSLSLVAVQATLGGHTLNTCLQGLDRASSIVAERQSKHRSASHASYLYRY